MAAFVFWASLATIIGVYFGYPLALSIGALGRTKSVRRSNCQPTVSVIVAAHNEEACIESKIKNVLASDYPAGKIELLIGSDGSSDRTEEIVRRFESAGVGLISFPQQHGKSAMQNGLVAHASGEILVFTDADCFASPEALGLAVENFADRSVGLVTARPQYSNENETHISENEGAYLRYETWLRRQESDRGILAMASGSFFAVRRSLWSPLDANLGDDFVLPLRVARSGLRNIVEPRAVAVTNLAQNRAASMLRLKTRIISKDFRALLLHRSLLNPIRFGSIAIGLWFHKLLRWLIPYFLIVAFATNLLLLDRPFFRVFFALQLAFYGLAAMGFTARRLGLPSPWSVPMSFCLVNAGALVGTMKCLAGGRSGTWQPQRQPISPAQSLRQVSRDAD